MPIQETVRTHGAAHPEERYQPELASTEVSQGTALFMTWSFVAIIFSVPLLQLAYEVSRGQTPGIAEIAKPLQAAAGRASSGQWSQAWSALRVMGDRMYFKNFETGLEHAAIAKAYFQPRLQEQITRLARFGNSKVTLGTGDWLFYQPGIDYVMGPDIIDPEQIRITAKRLVDKEGEQNPTPDPRPAILRLDQDCKTRGIHLIVFPAPDKASLQPEQLANLTLSGSLPPLTNRGYAGLVRDLRAKGVDVFDPRPAEVHSGEVRYLDQDTHWTPEFMGACARNLAAHIKVDLHLAPPAKVPQFQLRTQNAARLGDLVDMLNLHREQSIYTPNTVTIHQVLKAAGQPWEADPAADVLLLGDSYVNIFSQKAMGWGEAGGFGEHLSYELGRPLDLIAQNGTGVAGLRTELARVANTDRLDSKKIVIYEFAERDLLGHNWKVIPLPERRESTKPVPVPDAAKSKTPEVKIPEAKTPEVKTAEPKAPEPKAPEPKKEVVPATDLILTGHIVKASKVPAPGTAPYVDCLTFTMVKIDRIETGSYDGGPDILAVFWGMKNNVWLPAARYSVGDRLRLKVIPFKRADSSVRSIQRSDDTGDLDHQPYFVVEETVLN